MFVYVFVLIGLIELLPSLCAAQPPDAGEILRQQERNMPKFDRLPEPKITKEKEIESDEVLKAPAKGVTIEIKTIQISGGEGLESAEVLQSLVADAIGQHLDFSHLQKLAGKINHHLKEKGWLLAKAYLPKQDVTDGNIEIVITQGRLEIDDEGHSLMIEGSPDLRLDHDLIRNRMRYVISGDTLQGDNLERTLLLFSDIPGIQANTSIQKGKKAGTSRLGLKVQEGNLVTGSVTADDTGSRSTGTWQGNLNVNVNDAFGLGEQFTVGGTGASNMGIEDQGMIQGRVAYAMPIGYNGLQVNTNYSYLHYNVGREMLALGLNGNAVSTGIGFNYPFIRSRSFSINGISNYTLKATEDFIHKDSKTSDKEIHDGKLGINGQLLDSFFGGGMNQFSYDSTLGHASEIMSDAKAGDASTAKSLGRIYNKHNFSITRTQKLTDSFSLFFTSNGQIAVHNLPSAEKMSLAGASAVRAYPSGNPASGDSGYVANFEMRYDVPYKNDIASVQLVGFFDIGYIVKNANRWRDEKGNLLPQEQNDYSLQGAGIGVNVSLGSSVSIKGTWAHTVGNDPGAVGPSGDNQLLLNTALYF